MKVASERAAGGPRAGDFCKDAYFGWTEPVRHELERAYINAALKLADGLIEHGAIEEAYPVDDRALAIDPYSNALARRAIGLDARRFGWAAALDRFRRFRSALREIGVEPEPETLSLVASLHERRGPHPLTWCHNWAPAGSIGIMSDENLAQALRRSAREPEAFAHFYDEHSESLLAYLARRVYEPEVAFDLTAEVFARAFRARGRFRGSTNGQAAAWLYKIARRELARYFRKGSAERRALTLLGMQAPQLDEEQQARIEELAQLEDLRGALRTGLERLSQAHREALRLRIVEELPYSEVASRLDISEQAARARVSRGLKALASALNRKNPLLVEEKGP